MTRQKQQAAFRMLHAGEPFVMPNPWDPGSARMLEALGFQVLATTSSGFAFTLGRRDGEATLDEVVEHTAALDRSTMLPLSVDLENGSGAATRDVAQAVTHVADAGAVGCSIEDYGTVALSDHPVRLSPLHRSKTTDHGTVDCFDPFLASFHEGEPPLCWASPAHSGSMQQCPSES
jgi:2-methylisocitrate lyase-like PEP mutase family enzyme